MESKREEGWNKEVKTRKERLRAEEDERESVEVTFGDQRLFAVTFSHLCSSLMPEQCALAHLSLLTSLLSSLLRHLLPWELQCPNGGRPESGKHSCQQKAVN